MLKFAPFSRFQFTLITGSAPTEAKQMQSLEKSAIVIYLDKSTREALRLLVMRGHYPKLLEGINGLIYELAAKP